MQSRKYSNISNKYSFNIEKYEDALTRTNYKYLIFFSFSSPFSLPDGQIGENDFIKSICEGP